MIMVERHKYFVAESVGVGEVGEGPEGARKI